MAVFEVRAVSGAGDRSWENVWHIDMGASVDLPSDITDALAEFYISRTLSVYTVIRLVWRILGTSDEFIEQIIDTPGAVDATGFVPLPLFNTVKGVLQGAAGRPGVKYFRGFLTTSNLVGSAYEINSSVVSAILGALDTFTNQVSTSGGQILIGAAGRPSTAFDIQATVQMRQQHRKRRRSV